MWDLWGFTIITAAIYQLKGADSIVVPTTSCYVLDNSSHIFDFSTLIGHPFEHDGEDIDTVIRFCKDVESRSQAGYVDFGRFDQFNYFTAGSGRYNFVQEFYDGDLTKCEQSFDKRGRTTQVNIICGDCPNGQCKGGLGCICDVAYASICSLVIELAIPCEKQGLRVFEGFTVGLHPRSWEIVYNGMTQLGFEKAHDEFSFKTEQTHVALYMTAVSSLSSLVQVPMTKISPEKGLELRLSGSAMTGNLATTLSPSVLLMDWRCEKARDKPYEVEITIPIDNYEPIQFTLTKMCDYRQAEGGNSNKGWAVFGVLACIFIVISMLFCCGGFVYKTRVQDQRGIDALPGMTLLSACLETVSGARHGYTRPEEPNNPFPSQASWERPPASTQATSRTSGKYGSI